MTSKSVGSELLHTAFMFVLFWIFMAVGFGPFLRFVGERKGLSGGRELAKPLDGLTGPPRVPPPAPERREQP